MLTVDKFRFFNDDLTVWQQVNDQFSTLENFR